MKQLHMRLGKYGCSIVCGSQPKSSPRSQFFSRRYIFAFAVGTHKTQPIKPQHTFTKHTPFYYATRTPKPTPSMDDLKRIAYHTKSCKKGICGKCGQPFCKTRSLKNQCTPEEIKRWRKKKINPRVSHPETYPGCYGKYGDAYYPNNCHTCQLSKECLKQTTEDIAQ